MARPRREPIALEARTAPPPAPLPLRAWHALRTRGPRYAWHKALRRSLEPWPGLKRRLLYADPRDYWTLRGGREYFLEQEGQAARNRRSEWIADRIAAYRPASILEVGCGYGKQLGALATRLDARLVGVDFSPSQLDLACDFLDGRGVALALASGDRLPFPDHAFDLVLTSAVILHNPPPLAEAIRREVLRVARRWAAHNEDTDVTYNRYGYDTAQWYRRRGVRILECGPIPDGGPDAAASQFCVAEPWPG
jgi:SAM-dependent methyltransferase